MGIYDGYNIRDGVCTVLDAPRFGVTIDKNGLRGVRIKYDVRA